MLQPRLIALMLILAASTTHANVAPADTFIMDLELGMFACQVDEDSDHLLLFNISSICDGVDNCASAVDEDVSSMECREDCRPACEHGACLNNKGSQCYCDCDWGGELCDIPDVNECKNSPCHNMAYCTNTLGSYYCTCLPGFIDVMGGGIMCMDRDECQLAADSGTALCADNAHCVNVPGSFYCVCNDG
ncbi:PREDICTED: latent-transforming growth factor beta-binding protein 2-like, partial [Priapulus caudatus]|uniref:Latent-transforming growth factor beta-binding protein 2-like n=1 Tax=Priapulus caudatus TaxID=37621 RepID=A0ABM1DR48_PRICU